MFAIRAFDAFLREERIPVRPHHSLASHTTLKIGGPAEYLIEPRDESELAAVARTARECDVPVRFLGTGANLLVRDEGVPGAVVKLSHFTRRSGSYVQAGYGLPRLIKETVSEGLGGLEALAGIPASIGGAVAMNAGGRHGEIGAVVRYVDVMTPKGELRRLRHNEIGFGYRTTALRDRLVVGVGLDLRPDPTAAARYDEVLSGKKATQPLGEHTAGCMFRNPSGKPAGQLIDEAGLKGRAVGAARISEKHGNFIINGGGATAADVLRLVDLVRGKIPGLELEVLVW